MTQRLFFLLPIILAAGALMMLATASQAEKKAHKYSGPNACAECHKKETEIWKKTHHFKTFRNMPRNKEARRIANKLGIKRIKSDSLCLGCHFTQEIVRKKARVTSGISCESCHGAGKGWEKIHSEFSGKKNKEQESKSEAAARWKQSEARGMIRPNAFYKLAKNCYGCHVVPNEKLVNIGGHAAGSPFELLSWSQGEIRHNVWYSNGNNNKTASPKRRRMMYLAGIAVEIETALRAVGVATEKKDYAIRMAHRANNARKKLADVARALSDVVELRNMVKLSHSAGLKLNNKKSLFLAADKISREAQRLLSAYDGSTFASIDRLLPGPEKFRGKPSE